LKNKYLICPNLSFPPAYWITVMFRIKCSGQVRYKEIPLSAGAATVSKNPTNSPPIIIACRIAPPFHPSIKIPTKHCPSKIRQGQAQQSPSIERQLLLDRLMRVKLLSASLYPFYPYTPDSRLRGGA